MNSSRIYNNNSSFQPEKLVKIDELPVGEAKAVTPPPKEQAEESRPPQTPEPEELPEEEPENLYGQPDPEDDIENEKPEPEEPAEPPIDLEEIQQQLEEVYQKGFDDGLKQAAADYKNSGQTLFNIAEQLNNTREVILKNSMGELQELALTIAEKIIRHSITKQDDTILATVEYAIRQAVKSDEFYVCINQDDYEVISRKIPELIAKFSGLENIFIKIDNSIEPGGCLVESDNCTVDATIASQLELVADHIKNNS
ncbi:MAG: hypothetical protein CSB24_02585 [Deltaproteobacteria bacterium]|nr:MAG: hypothetical protein CSB24_02585 [Deltaproteobacteria bacterium]